MAVAVPLRAIVRLFSDGTRVQRISVIARDTDTTPVRRSQLRMQGEVFAILDSWAAVRHIG